MSLGGVTAICTQQCSGGSENTRLIPDDMKQRPGDTASRRTHNSVSVLKLQLWEETETASERQSHGSTRSMDQLLQEYENSANPL